VRLLERLRRLLHPVLGWATEVTLALIGDRRAWDAVITGRGFRIGVEAETRLGDAQAVARKLALKERDGDVSGVILLVADTRHNRELQPAVAAALGDRYATNQHDIVRALGGGRDPGRSGIVRL
jgi:hypothetical protein